MPSRSPSAAPPSGPLTGGRSRVVSAVLGALLLGSVAVIALDQTGRLGGPGVDRASTGSDVLPTTPSPGPEIAPSPTSPTPAPAPGNSSDYGGLK